MGDDALRRLRRMPLIGYTTRHFMGRLVAGIWRGRNLTFQQRFEMDSYHAIMAMVADGAGWTILTPLGWMRAQRFRAAVDVVPLPVAPLSRRIVLVARRGVLGGMPGQVAERLRELLEARAVRSAVAELPWLAGSMRYWSESGRHLGGAAGPLSDLLRPDRSKPCTRCVGAAET